MINHHMNRRQLIAETLPPDFVHVVTGTWMPKTIHIDGELVTVNMLHDRVREEEEAMTDAYNDYHGAWGLDLYENVETFDWGRRSNGAQLLSLAWIFWFGATDVHDFVFRREIEVLPRTDFRLCDSIRVIFYGGRFQPTSPKFNRMIIQFNFASSLH